MILKLQGKHAKMNLYKKSQIKEVGSNMTKRIEKLTFHFENGGKWDVDPKNIGDIWIRRVAKSIGRINDGEILVIYPAQSFKIEILEEADTFATTDINQGSLESGMFETILRNNNIEWLTITWKNAEKDIITFPYEAEDADLSQNIHMSGKIGNNKNLYIVIDPENKVDDVFSEVE